MSDLYNVSWNKGVGLFKSLSKPYTIDRTKWIKKNSKPKKPLKIKKTKAISKGEKKRISREIQKSKRRIKFRKFKCSTFVTNDELNTLRNQIKSKEFRNQKQIELCNKLMFNDRTVDCAFFNIKSIIKAQRSKKKWFFDLKVRSRKNNRIVTFNARDYKGIKKNFGCINGLNDISGEFKFLYNKQEKQWYLLTQEAFVPPTTKSEFPMTCSLDPGVREFQKVFSLNEGCVYTVGTKKDIDKISKLKAEMEKAQDKIKKMPYSCGEPIPIYRRIKQKLQRLRDMKATKVSNKRKDAHWKLASFLTDKFDFIILPDFTTQGMMSKTKSCLGKKSRKEMRDWGHYMFKEKLRWMCIKKNKTLIDGKEYYTSKTCCCCLTLTTKIGSGKKFDCPNCPNNIDRDINGAINNLMIMISN
jgi:transposase